MGQKIQKSKNGTQYHFLIFVFFYLSQILSGYIFPAFVQNSVIYFIRCDILLKMQ